MDVAQPLRIAVPLQARGDRRGAERIPAAMPVRAGGQEGTTQDLSANGLAFVSGHRYAVGDRVRVVVDYLLDGHNYPLECDVEVMRVQPDAEGWLIGARLTPEPRPDTRPADDQPA